MSILVVIGRIYRYQFQCNYLKNQKKFVKLFIACLEFILNVEYFKKKNESHSISISEVIDFERRAYLNA